MFFKAFLSCVLLTGFAQIAAAQDSATPYEARTYKASDEESLPYRFLAPLEVQENKKYPLVVFLHGAGERGDDNLIQLVHVAGELATEEMRKRYPAYVIAPQCPKDGWWGGSISSRRLSDRPRPKPSLDPVLKLIDQLTSELPIDSSRIYITGLSMGGYGTFEALKRHPHKFAAAAPICGGGDQEAAQAFASVPIWIFHGDADNAVPVDRSREMVTALRAAGGSPIYTEYPGVGHNSWTATAQNRLFWDWMFAQSRKE